MTRKHGSVIMAKLRSWRNTDRIDVMTQNDAERSGWAIGWRIFVHAIHCEWTKFWSVRSTWWALGVLVAVLVGFSVLIAAATSESGLPGSQAMTSVYASDPTQFGVDLGQLVMAILAVLVITDEFMWREIGLSLLAVPRRWHLFAAKVVVVGCVAFGVTFIAVYVAVLCGWPMVRSFAIDDRFTWFGVRIVLGASLAVMLVAIMALGVGAVLRSSAGAIGVVVMVTFVLPLLLGGIDVHWAQVASNYIMGNTISGLFSPPSEVDPAQGVLSFGRSLWVCLLWAIVPLCCGGVALYRRDV